MPLGYTTCIWADGLRHVFVAPCFFSEYYKSRMKYLAVFVLPLLFLTMIRVHVFVAPCVFATTFDTYTMVYDLFCRTVFFFALIIMRIRFRAQTLVWSQE